MKKVFQKSTAARRSEHPSELVRSAHPSERRDQCQHLLHRCGKQGRRHRNLPATAGGDLGCQMQQERQYSDNLLSNQFHISSNLKQQK